MNKEKDSRKVTVDVEDGKIQRHVHALAVVSNSSGTYATEHPPICHLGTIPPCPTIKAGMSGLRAFGWKKA